MKVDIDGAGKSATPAHGLLGCFVVNQKIHNLVGRKGGHHLEKNFLDAWHSIGPRFRILGPAQPRRRVTTPFGGHVIAKFSRS
jgi:hypothetical protein